MPVTFGGECEAGEHAADFSFGTPSGAGLDSVGAGDLAWSGSIARAQEWINNKGIINSKNTRNTKLGPIRIIACLQYDYQNLVTGLDSDRFFAPEHICEL